ncbi:hypothetical protein DITRI_Ditri17bG0128500 [Diplodiscus trichospermus]
MLDGYLLGPDQHNSANAIFCLWMAVGNILGFSAGASGSWHRWFPFLKSRACCEACANLKAAFLVAVVQKIVWHLCRSFSYFVSLLLYVLLRRNNAKEGYEQMSNTKPANSKDTNVEVFSDVPGAVLVNSLTSLRHLPPAMHSVLIVMALSWLSWFPFFLFDTDWMGREVYHGNPKGNASEIKLYDQGVREGAFGLLLNSVVLGVSSFFVEPMCQWMGSRLVWAMSNYTVFACMAATAIISLISVGEYSQGIKHVIGGSAAIRIASLVVFALLGFPLAITYSVPFSVTAELTADSGGLAIGVLNLAIVIPQIVSLGTGQWNALFGGGNMPAFILASFCALAAGIIATLRLPDPDLSSSLKSSGFHFGQ